MGCLDGLVVVHSIKVWKVGGTIHGRVRLHTDKRTPVVSLVNVHAGLIDSALVKDDWV